MFEFTNLYVQTPASSEPLVKLVNWFASGWRSEPHRGFAEHKPDRGASGPDFAAQLVSVAR